MRNRVKNILFKSILALRCVLYVILGNLDTLLHRRNDLFILSYHSIANDEWRFSVDLREIKKQIDYLSRHYDFVTLDDVSKYMNGKRNFSKPSVILTFDDGYKDVLKIKNYLIRKDIRPALFLLANTKQANTKELATKRPFLNKKEIRSLLKAGWEIGCHSGTHANLSTLSQKQLEDEIIVAKKKLEKDLRMTIKYFAYPRGKYSPTVLKFVRKAKYRFALTMDDGNITRKSDALILPRIGIDRTHSFAEFKTTFSPSVVLLRQLLKKTIVGRYL